MVENLKALPPAARDRVLQAALADHLDSSQRLLLEVANGATSLDEGRAGAETLLSANRLYRRAAEHAGQRTGRRGSRGDRAFPDAARRRSPVFRSPPLTGADR